MTVSPALWLIIAWESLQALEILPDSGSASAGPTMKYSSSTSSSRINNLTFEPRETVFPSLEVIISAWVIKFCKYVILASTSPCLFLAAS